MVAIYSSTCCSVSTRFTFQPRSPRLGLKINGNFRPALLSWSSTWSLVEGYVTRTVVGFTDSGIRFITSAFDSPNIPPIRIPGLEAEKNVNERALSESHNQYTYSGAWTIWNGQYSQLLSLIRKGERKT